MKKKRLTDFIVKDEKKLNCEMCGKIVDKEKMSVLRVSTHDGNCRYKTSGRKMIMNYKISLCKKCFELIVEKLKGVMI